MTLMNTVSIAEVKDAILKHLEQQSVTPTALFMKLSGHYAESELKHALSELLDDSRVEFETNRTLQVK